MLVKILIIVLVAVVAAFLLYFLYIRKCISAKVCAVISVCCLLVLVVGSMLLLKPGAEESSGNKNNVYANADPTDRDEESRIMDMIMWYDIDTGPTTNGRPQRGWWPLNPQHPDKVSVSGNYRTTNPLLGLYDQRDPKTARQHLYWIAALGCNGMAVDWTNYTSHRLALQNSGEGWYKYCSGVYKNTEVLLNASKSEMEFEAPKIYITVRLSGNDYDSLSEVLTDVYTLYEKYPEAWYFLDDGTSQSDKPFIVIFIDSTIREQLIKGDFTFKDDRFNIRYSNGYLSSSTKSEKDGTKSISGDVPLWFFVEAEEDPSAGEGMYRIFHKDSADGSVEQMIAWASVHKGGENWDELNHVLSGMTTFERTLRGVAELSPKALLVNRFNYALAWKEEPQEGLSLYASTHIEPNEDFGFLIFDNVKENLYDLNKWNHYAPAAPKIVSTSENTVYLNLDEYPTEYRIYLDGEQGEWTYYNVNDGIEIPEEWQGQTYYIQTRNTFGESEVSEYTADMLP